MFFALSSPFQNLKVLFLYEFSFNLSISTKISSEIFTGLHQINKLITGELATNTLNHLHSTTLHLFWLLEVASAIFCSLQWKSLRQSLSHFCQIYYPYEFCFIYFNVIVKGVIFKFHFKYLFLVYRNMIDSYTDLMFCNLLNSCIGSSEDSSI